MVYGDAEKLERKCWKPAAKCSGTSECSCWKAGPVSHVFWWICHLFSLSDKAGYATEWAMDRGHRRPCVSFAVPYRPVDDPDSRVVELRLSRQVASSSNNLHPQNCAYGIGRRYGLKPGSPYAGRLLRLLNAYVVILDRFWHFMYCCSGNHGMS